MKSIFGAIAGFAFLFLIYTVGALENNSISLMQSAVQSAVALAGMFGFTYLAGGFKENQNQSNKGGSPPC